jgi:ABC-type Na+ efflux pump permease subunit
MKPAFDAAKQTQDFSLLSIVAVVLVILSLLMAPAVFAQEKGNSEKKITVKIVNNSEKASKARDTTRSRSADKTSLALSPASVPRPTKLTVNFPTLVNPGQNVKGYVRFNDPDDYIFSIFITVFYPDGDVVTSTLYDYRDEQTDLWKGRIDFWVEMPDSETPLPGTIVITCSDEYLNVSQVTTNFIQNY